MPRRLAIGVLTFVLTACGSAVTERDEASARWDRQRPDSYSFRLESSCGERSLIGTFEISVAGDEVTGAEGLDDRARQAVDELSQPGDIPSLDDLLALADEALREGADVVDVTYHEDTGAPRDIRIDVDEQVTDDEQCYSVSDVRAAGSS